MNKVNTPFNQIGLKTVEMFFYQLSKHSLNVISLARFIYKHIKVQYVGRKKKKIYLSLWL